MLAEGHRRNGYLIPSLLSIVTYKVVQRVKDNYYLYEVTAVWDPEKKNSRQKRKYIGKCDKDGNLVAPKVPSVPRVKALGKPYLMYHVAMDMGLRDKLRQVYGDRGDALFTACVHRSTRTSLPRHNIRSMEGTMLSQITGVDAASVLHDTENTIDVLQEAYERRYDIFRLLDKGNSVMVYELNSLRNVSVLNINLKDTNRGFYDFPPMDTYLGISEDPNSAFYFSISARTEDRWKDLLRMEQEIRELGPREITFFMDRGAFSEHEAEQMANSGVLFVRTLQADSPFGIELLERYDEELLHEGTMTLLYDAIRRVLDRQIVLGDIRCRLIVMVNEEQRLSQLNALFRGMAQFEQSVSAIRWSAGAMDRIDAIEDREGVRGLYTFECGPDGMARAVRDPKAIREREIYLGKTVILTNSEESWEVLIFKHFRHHRFKSESDTFRNELQDGSMLMGSLDAAVSTFLNEFLAIAIRTHLSDLLHLIFAGSKNYVDVLQEVSGIYAVSMDGKWYVSEIDEGQRAIFDSLGIPVPTSEVVEGMVESYSKRHSVRGRGPRRR